MEVGMHRLACSLGLAVTLAAMATVAGAQGDGKALYDPMRPVMMLGRDRAVLQWFTRTPCVTRLQLRKGVLPCRTYGLREDPWKAGDVQVLAGPPGLHTYHRITLLHLAPGTRYYYRCYDPGADPTTLEQTWGAQKPWGREWAFSTLAPKGRKTIIRIPVKVLLMPNVVNVASAHLANGRVIPPPPDLTGSELARIKEEYATAARFLFINNGMRVWYDFHIFVDARRQRWGPEPPNVSPIYKGWPACRSYAGTDFAPPGGGDFTVVDTLDLQHVGKEPVHENFPYVGQIEQAFPRRWDEPKKEWVFYNSGGGTYGADEWARGIPGRSQYLGGGDTAWLATHEFHHQVEALGTISFGTDENDRVIFDHFFPRRRVRKPDGTYDEWTWQTSWAHGEHWDGISYFDRLLTPVQWLRLMFGETITVADADEDGVPDDDSRLPFDEKRFGSDPHKAATAGGVPDLARIQQSTWAPCPLTSTWNKAPYPLRRPKPRADDTDGDGVPDAVDPYPLYPWEPFIWPMTATVDGDPREWSDIPLAGTNSAHGVTIRFKQAHDDAAYYACFQMQGPWAKVSVGLDGEGLGYYTTDSTYAFDVLNLPGGAEVRPTGGNHCPGMEWKARVDAAGETTVEISIPNRGSGLWFWTGGGRPVGAAISLWTSSGAPLSIYDPYHFFYARMLQRFGRPE